jgi:hypothetical protein
MQVHCVMSLHGLAWDPQCQPERREAGAHHVDSSWLHAHRPGLPARHAGEVTDYDPTSIRLVRTAVSAFGRGEAGRGRRR